MPIFIVTFQLQHTVASNKGLIDLIFQEVNIAGDYGKKVKWNAWQGVT